jgi:hypothetical protein
VEEIQDGPPQVHQQIGSCPENDPPTGQGKDRHCQFPDNNNSKDELEDTERYPDGNRKKKGAEEKALDPIAQPGPSPALPLRLVRKHTGLLSVSSGMNMRVSWWNRDPEKPRSETGNR